MPLKQAGGGDCHSPLFTLLTDPAQLGRPQGRPAQRPRSFAKLPRSPSAPRASPAPPWEALLPVAVPWHGARACPLGNGSDRLHSQMKTGWLNAKRDPSGLISRDSGDTDSIRRRPRWAEQKARRGGSGAQHRGQRPGPRATGGKDAGRSPPPHLPPRGQSGPRARQGWGGWKPCPLEGLVRGATRYGGRRRKKRGIPLGPPPPRRSPAGQINTTNDFTQHNRMAEFNASSFPFPSTGLGFKNKKMR